MVASVATPAKRFYSIIPITIILLIVPFKDILARGMVASGTTPPKRFYIVLFLLQ